MPKLRKCARTQIRGIYGMNGVGVCIVASLSTHVCACIVASLYLHPLTSAAIHPCAYIRLYVCEEPDASSFWGQAKTVGAHTKKMCPCESPLIERTLEFRGTCQKSVPLPQNPYVERTFEALGAHREGQPRRYIYIYFLIYSLNTL